jgi:hypothetical protein
MVNFKKCGKSELTALPPSIRSSHGGEKMLSSIRLRNFRSLGDTGLLELKPITLLLGQNSSGKSTFLRSLPLVRQSIRTRSNTPILWYGDYVDFGSFEEVQSTFSKDGSISLSFFFNRLSLTPAFYQPFYRERGSLSKVELGINLADADGRTRLKSFYVRVCDDEARFDLDSKGQFTSLHVNGQDYSRAFPKDRVAFTITDVVPQAYVAPEKGRGTIASAQRVAGITDSEIFTLFSRLFDSRVSTGTIRNITRRIEYAPGEEFVGKIENLNVNLKSWNNVRSIISGRNGPSGIEHVRALYFIGAMPDILSSIGQSLSASFRDLSYVGPSRATGERYYRHQELAIDQIDPQGHNLAMYLFSLSSPQRDAFSSWLEDEIGYALRVGRQGGHIQIELREKGGEEYHNLADMGYGFSQILPVLAQVWGKEQGRNGGRSSSSPFIAIEQPELHLHPAYQARIADVMASTITRSKSTHRRPIRFVVETHSEALINRMGELIYEGKVAPSDVAIYLFHRNASTDATAISKSTYDADGNLTDWPLGFFSSRTRL